MIETKDKYDFSDLLEIMSILRGDNGCPWDREQSILSLKKYILEECYEVIDACDIGGAHLADELGDLLLQIVFISQIASEEKSFNITQVTTMICKKMIHRHPHIFSNVVANTSNDVLTNWESIKRAERGITTHTEALMDVTPTLPATLRAYKVQHKASKVGFDWDDVKYAIDKVREETAEVEEAIEQKNEINIYSEMGDLLFACVNVSRFLNVNPELALSDTIKKFINRFEYIEKSAKCKGKNMENMSLSEMDVLWEEAKTVL